MSDFMRTICLYFAALIMAGCQSRDLSSGNTTGSSGSGSAAATNSMGSGTAQSASTGPSLKELIKQGEGLYVRYCQLCHGKEGIGYAADHANQLRNPLFLASSNNDLIWFGIEYGRPGTPMAAFGKTQGGPLDEEQIRSLMKYVQSLNYVELDREIVTGSPTAGAPVYQERCAQCHGSSGEGKTAPSLNSPYFLASASNGYIKYAVMYGRPSTPMQAFATTLTSQQISDIVALIRSWARTVSYGPADGEPIPPLSSLVLNSTAEPATLKPVNGHYVSVDEVHGAIEAGKRIVILDARATSDWMNFHIVNAYPAPFYNPLDPNLAKALPRDGTPIVAYCSCPHAASDALAKMLAEAGVPNVYVLDEGILIWAQKKYPIIFGRAK